MIDDFLETGFRYSFSIDLFGGFRLGRKFSYFQPHFVFLKEHSRSYVTEKGEMWEGKSYFRSI